MSVTKTGQKGLTVYNSTKAYNGYNFFCPFWEYGWPEVQYCWLMDMEGRFVHRWRMPYPPGCHGILLPNSNILFAGRLKTLGELGLGWTEEFSGLGGILIELDWDSNIAWKVEVPYQGHDFTVMPNGHIMYIAWEPKGIVPDENIISLKKGDLEDYYPRELVLDFAKEMAVKKGKTETEIPTEIPEGKTVKSLSKLLRGDWWKTLLAAKMIKEMQDWQIDEEIREKLSRVYDAIC